MFLWLTFKITNFPITRVALSFRLKFSFNQSCNVYWNTALKNDRIRPGGKQVLVDGSKLRRNVPCRDGVPKFATADNECTEKHIERCNTRGIIANNYRRAKSQWITKACYSQNFCRTTRIVCVSEGKQEQILIWLHSKLKESAFLFHKCRVNDAVKYFQALHDFVCHLCCSLNVPHIFEYSLISSQSCFRTFCFSLRRRVSTCLHYKSLSTTVIRAVSDISSE